MRLGSDHLNLDHLYSVTPAKAGVHLYLKFNRPKLDASRSWHDD